jgi:hypothetical protein
VSPVRVNGSPHPCRGARCAPSSADGGRPRRLIWRDGQQVPSKQEVPVENLLSQKSVKSGSHLPNSLRGRGKVGKTSQRNKKEISEEG